MTELPNFPLLRSSPLDPPPELHDFRLEGPLTKVKMWNGSEAWLVTRFQDVRAVLVDKRFSESPAAPGYPMLSPARAALVASDTFMTHVQGEEHSALRRVLSRELGVKRVEAQREATRQLVNELIDDVVAKGGPLDLVQHFAMPLPMRVISRMLGVPYRDHEFFEQNSNLRVALHVPPNVPVEATRALADYFSVILKRKEQEPGDEDDILTRLAREHIGTGAITHKQAVNLAYTLVQAGHETTGNQISLGVLLLLRNRDQLQAIIDDKSLVKGAVEEMLRYSTILQLGMVRAALEDVEVGGRLIQKGEGVFVMLASANHDPDAFLHPEKFDVTRPERNHVAFSYGIHQCAGQQLARMELQEVFSTLFQRLPNLRLAVPFEELRFKHANITFGVEQLPVVW
jgi:cytochrome P450